MEPVGATGLIIALVVGYLLGSIPFGLLFARMAGLGDIRKAGSGNIGATNALRLGGKKLGAATLVADVGKGAFAVWIAHYWGPEAAIAAGFGAFVGHIAPVWLGFRGGKGVATFLGVMLAAHPPAGGAALGAWLGVAAVSRLSSQAALSASVAAPIVAALNGEIALTLASAAMAALLWWRHRENIRRIRDGTEPRIGESVAPPSTQPPSTQTPPAAPPPAQTPPAAPPPAQPPSTQTNAAATEPPPPGPGKADPGAPEVSAPDLGAPDLSKPDPSAPEPDEPDLSESDPSKPDPSKSDLSKPDLNKPDFNKPDFNKPDFNKPDFNKPDFNKKEA